MVGEAEPELQDQRAGVRQHQLAAVDPVQLALERLLSSPSTDAFGGSLYEEPNTTAM